MARRLPPSLSTLPLSVCPWRAFYPSPVRILNSFTLGNPGSSLSQDFLGTLKIFGAYIISQAIGFSRYVASFGAYIISQATGFLRYVASFGAYIISQATGFLRYAASFEPQPGFFRITGKKYFVLYRLQAQNISYSIDHRQKIRILPKRYFGLYLLVGGRKRLV